MMEGSAGNVHDLGIGRLGDNLLEEPQPFELNHYRLEAGRFAENRELRTEVLRSRFTLCHRNPAIH